MVVQSIPLITDLRTQNRNIGILYVATGQTTPGDNNGGMYMWNPSSTAADDSFYVIQVTGVATGRWLRIGAASNIYTADGSLINNRTVTLNGYTLNFAGSTFSSTFLADGTVSLGSLAGTGTRYVVAGPTGILGAAGTIPTPGTPTRFVETFTASAGQTTFNTANTLFTYFFDVYLNGVLLDNTSYTASANQVVLTDPCSLSDIVQIIGFYNLTYVGTLPPQAGNAGRFLTTDGTSLSWAVNPLGTVTSVDMSVPTGFAISGNPITSSGTLALGFAAGYSLPANSVQANWTTAYNRSLTSASVSGTSTKTLTLNKQDGGTITATWSDFDTQGVTSVSVNVGSTGTDVNANVVNPTTTPTININVPDASATTRGALTTTDWTTFNNKQAAITLTTVGSSGAATFIANVLNIPDYGAALSGYVPTSRQLTINGTTFDLTANRTWNVGTVTSVDFSVPTGFAIANNPITTSGTLALTFAAGYSLPTNVKQSNWDDAYSWVAAFPTLTGNTGKFLSNNGTALIWETVDLSSRVPITRQLTINGVTYDLSADRTWTIVAGVSSVTGTAPISAVNVSGAVTISISQATTTTDGYLSSTDWNTFNSKQGALTLTTTGTSGAATLIGNTLNIPIYQGGVTSFNTRTGAITLTSTDVTTALGYTPVTNARTLTINGTAFDLTANRTWSVGTVTSVGLSMPAAFTVTNSPITGSGTINVAAAGTSSQYIRGDGTLADFPGGGTGGGGASVSYYLNGSVNQGTIGGNTYYELNKVPILGAGTDFSIGADGYIAQFITDAGDPNSLLIPAGNWNFEMYFSASSAGGTPLFYIELYKYNGTTLTLIASNSVSPEFIAFGTTINPYYTALAVPETVLSLTDRLAIRVYVQASGRTITLHTEDNHLCQILTTFTTGLQALNGLTAQVQNFATGTAGSDFNINSSVSTHTFNLPVASSANTGKLSNTDWTTFNSKEPAIAAGTVTQYYRGDKTFQTLNTSVVPEVTNLYFTNTRARQAISLTTTGTSGAATYDNTTGVLNIPQYQGVLTNPVTGTGTNNELAYFTSTGSTIGSLTTATYPSLTEISYVKGVTSAIQTQLNAKEPTLTKGNLTEATSSVLIITGGTGAVIGSGTSIQVRQSSVSQSGFLSSTDWSTFNSKEPAITAGTTSQYFRGDKTFQNLTTTVVTEGTNLYYTDARARAAISITTTGTSGAATYIGGVINIPQYQGQITLTTTGNSGAATFTSNTLNVPNYTLSGLGGVPTSRTLTINSISFDLSADRSWTIGPTIYSRGLQKFTATAGQTTFTITNGYTVGLVDVYRNGVKLDNALEFTASNGTTVVLTDAAALNDVIEVYKYGSEYIPNNALRQVNTFTATGGQTTFSVTYSVGLIDVFYNGAKLAAAEYTATNGTSVVLASACVAGDIVEIIAYSYLVNGYSGISGSGNSGYIPKFTSATSIGNSLIQDNGTTITLGGALSGTSAVFSSTVTSNSTSGAASFITSGSGTQGGASFIDFIRVTNTSAGATNPNKSYRLNSAGTIEIVNSAYSAVIYSLTNAGAATYASSVTATKYIANAQATYASMTYEETIKYASSPAGIWFGNSFNSNNNVALQLRTSNDGTSVQALTISPIGNVGIGTASPAQLLHIQSSSSGGQNLRIQTSISAGRNYIQFANGSGDMGYLAYGGADSKFYIVNQLNDDMIFSTHNTERMRITSGGRVIVGTNSSNALEVFSDGDTEIGFSYATRGNVYAKIIGDITNASPLGGEIAFQTATGGTLSERMRITSGGLVGIGLPANGTGTGMEFATSAATPRINWLVSSVYILEVNANSSQGYIKTNANVPLLFGTNDTERMRIDSAGRIIGTVNGTNGQFQINQNDSGTNVDAQIYVMNNRNATSGYHFAKFFSGFPSGTQDVEFAFRGDGIGYSDGGWTTPASDYAEYFESTDGSALPVGSTVVIENGKVRVANSSDTNIVGVIRPKTAPLFLGNNAEFSWNQKYLKDEFGGYILDEEGMKTLNPSYDPELEYIPREKRDEWNIVGLVGQIPVLKNQPKNSNWIKMRDISDTVEEWLVK